MFRQGSFVGRSSNFGKSSKTTGLSRVKVFGPQAVRYSSLRYLSQVPAAGRLFTSDDDAVRYGIPGQGGAGPVLSGKGTVCSSDVDNRPGALQFRVEIYGYQVISVSFVTTCSQDRINPIKAHYTFIQVSLHLSM